MKKLLTAIIALVAFVVFMPSVSSAAVSQSSGKNVIAMTATNDTCSSISRVTIKRVKIIPSAAAKYYELRETTNTGTLIWKGLTGDAPTSSSIPAEPTNIKTGSAAVVLVTDDTTPTLLLEY